MKGLLTLLFFGLAVPWQRTHAYSVQLNVSDDSIDGFPVAQPPRITVQTKQELVSILTPVYPDEHTLGLLRNQLRTFAAFADVASFKQWIMVAPEDKMFQFEMFLDFELPRLPSQLSDKIRVVADEVCAPELEPKRFEALAFNDAAFVQGWLKQQLLKLACAHLVETPFYLITDADTFFLNPFSAGDLFLTAPCSASSNIVCGRQAKNSYRAKTDMQQYVNGSQLLWIRNSAKTLQVEVPTGVKQKIGVTPQIMARPLVAAMAAHLGTMLQSEVWEQVTWRAYLVSKLTEFFGLPKSEQQRSNTPWTEYNLYWVFAHHAGLWDRYHVHKNLQSEHANAWHSEEFDDWDPCANSVVDKWNPGRPVSGDEIWTRLAPCTPGYNQTTIASS